MNKNTVISRLSGGLGNQMFQYACGYAVSKKLNANLLLDNQFLLHKPSQANYTLRDFELDAFQLEAMFARESDARRFISIAPGILQKLKHKFFGNPEGYFKETAKFFQPAIFNLHLPAYLDGYWQNEKYFCEYRAELLHSFSPKEEPSLQNKKLATEILNSPSVCMHVRRGDYVSNSSANQFHGTCSPSYYEKAAQMLSAENSLLVYFVFSDDIAWAKAHIKLPGAVTYIEHNQGKASHWDLYLMKQGQHHIIANSSFSWWGAWLCERSGQKVIAPASWFQGIERYEITPNPWILL